MAEEKASEQTSVLLEETRLFNPPKDLVENSNVMQYMKKKGFKTEKELRDWASKNLEEFWGEMGKEYATWFKPFTQVLDWKPPYAKWFVGGLVNACYNSVDRHMKTAVKNKVAYIAVGEPVGDVRRFTYADLYREVNKLANAMKNKLGVKKGDRVSIYMPMIPELPIAMLACAKIGAIHSVVFSGFSTSAYAARVQDGESIVSITVDGFWRRGKVVPLKEGADEALQTCPTVKHQIVYKRCGNEVKWNPRDVWWHELVKDQSAECECEQLDPEHRLYILYTSGTTGKPKGIEHAHGGYCVGTPQTLHWVFDLKPNDVWWCTADIGWVTGHSYIVYAPLMLGVTSIIYEGSPDFPDFSRWWQIIEEHKVSVLYTAPTAIRMFMKAGAQWSDKCNLKSLRLLGTVGEPINPEAWIWYRTHIGRGELQIMDTWWQTETGTFINSPLPITPLKPGSCTMPLPGYNVQVWDESGKQVPTGQGGNLVIMTPYPTMLRDFYKDPARYMKTYWDHYWKVAPGVYLAGDKGRVDKDGYFWVQGRIDDVIKVAGHRLGNSEVESAAVSHPAVAEAAVIGKPDAVKGEVIIVFAILRGGVTPSEDLKKDISKHIRATLGPIAIPEAIYFVNDVPKTRSGKIMRRVIRARAMGQPVGDISTLMNPEAVDGIPKIV